MAAPKGKVALPDGRVVDGVNVNVEESNERWSEITLQDGTKIRIKLSVIAVRRAENEYDPQGRPYYSIDMTPVIAVTEVPENLLRKKN